MKLFNYAALLTCSLFSMIAISQETIQKIPYNSNHRLSLVRSVEKSTSCGVDTIVYPYLKEMTFTAAADSFFVDAMVGNVRTAAQAYHSNEQLQIHGVQFWGGAYSTSSTPQTLQVRAYLYSVDANNMPLVKLDSADVTVTNSYDFYEAVFATPYTYNQNFAVAVRSVPNDTLAVMTNNAGNTWTNPNYGESLAWRRFGSGTWNSTLSFFGQDLEYMIFPIVSYDITADFTTSAATCADVASQFDNTSSSNLGNRMLNLHAFDEHWNLAAADSTFTWDNGTTLVTEDISYTFTTAGTYPISLTAEMLGYYTSCSDTYTEAILVTTSPVISVTPSTPVVICDGEAVELFAFPSSGVTYQWLLDGAEETDSIYVNYVADASGN